MENATFGFGVPENETVHDYAPGSVERARLKTELGEQSGNVVEIPLLINGKPVYSGKTQQVVMPCEHGHILAKVHLAGERDVEAAINAAVKARAEWSNVPFEERASILLRAADLLAGPYRHVINAATMLGQSKTVYQAEIDAAADPREVKTGNGDFGEDFPDYRWQVEIGDTEIEVLKKISLTVTHSRMAARNGYRLILYKVLIP